MPSETEPFAPHALLRRLGQSPLQGKFPLVGLLASIYDSIAEDGRKLRETSDAAASAEAEAADDAVDSDDNNSDDNSDNE
jgi:hypothetical protein